MSNEDKFFAAAIEPRRSPVQILAFLALLSVIACAAFYFSQQPSSVVVKQPTPSPPLPLVEAVPLAALPPVQAEEIPIEFVEAVARSMPKTATRNQHNTYAQLLLERARRGMKADVESLSSIFGLTVGARFSAMGWLVKGELSDSEFALRYSRYMDKFRVLNLEPPSDTPFYIDELLLILRKYPDWNTLQKYASERYGDSTQLSLPEWIESGPERVMVHKQKILTMLNESREELKRVQAEKTGVYNKPLIERKEAGLVERISRLEKELSKQP